MPIASYILRGGACVDLSSALLDENRSHVTEEIFERISVDKVRDFTGREDIVDELDEGLLLDLIICEDECRALVEDTSDPVELSDVC